MDFRDAYPRSLDAKPVYDGMPSMLRVIFSMDTHRLACNESLMVLEEYA